MRVVRQLYFAISFLYLATCCPLSDGVLWARPAYGADANIPQLQAAAQKGFIPQQVQLAAAYFTGSGVTQDAKLAAYWYEKAAKSGDAEAENQIGFLYQTGQGVHSDPARAFHWYQLSAASGYVRAKVNLGVLYLWGIGVQKNESLAADFFQQAAARGDGAAAGYLGDLYYFGKGVKLDKAESDRWYSVGARLHDPVSAFNLGTLLSVDSEHAHDLPRAAALLRDSASAGYIHAMHSLGLLLTNHPEFALSAKESRSLLEKASSGGSWRSSVVLGILARDGKGATPDPENAYYLFHLALLQGGEPAARLLENDLKALSAQLAADRITTIAANADAWFAKHPFKLDTVYRIDGNSRRFPAYARAVAGDDVHAGQLVFPPPA
jgi:TPR repeat protein